MRRNEIGFGGYDAWTERVYAEDARNADRLDAKLKIEAHWLERGVTARRKRNQGRLAKLWEMRAARAAMIGPQGTAKLAAAKRRLASDFQAPQMVAAFDDNADVVKTAYPMLQMKWQVF